MSGAVEVKPSGGGLGSMISRLGMTMEKVLFGDEPITVWEQEEERPRATSTNLESELGPESDNPASDGNYIRREEPVPKPSEPSPTDAVSSAYA
mmetsp:Transcript_30397/g.96996  ORF Transcript_30397/g.96996 Transcript_30397/m.96996 type:complete len:94 (+) Transcript_30397:361-642(+)